MGTKILRMPTIIVECGRSRSSHYLDIKLGLFTKPVPIGRRAVGWPSNEVSAINAFRIAGKTPDEIRDLVIKLEADRKILALVGVNHDQ